jgi:hypothetical protein
MTFPGRWTGRGKSIECHLFLQILGLLEFLWGYLKDQLYSQRAKTLDELKSRITALTLNVTKDMLQRVWHEVDYG